MQSSIPKNTRKFEKLILLIGIIKRIIFKGQVFLEKGFILFIQPLGFPSTFV